MEVRGIVFLAGGRKRLALSGERPLLRVSRPRNCPPARIPLRIKSGAGSDFQVIRIESLALDGFGNSVSVTGFRFPQVPRGIVYRVPELPRN